MTVTRNLFAVKEGGHTRIGEGEIQCLLAIAGLRCDKDAVRRFQTIFAYGSNDDTGRKDA